MADDDNPVPRGGWLVRLGGVLFAIGALAALLALVPLVSDAIEPHASLWFLAVGGIGVGVGLSLLGLVVDARHRSRYFAGTVGRLDSPDEPPHN